MASLCKKKLFPTSQWLSLYCGCETFSDEWFATKHECSAKDTEFWIPLFCIPVSTVTVFSSSTTFRLSMSRCSGLTRSSKHSCFGGLSMGSVAYLICLLRLLSRIPAAFQMLTSMITFLFRWLCNGKSPTDEDVFSGLIAMFPYAVNWGTLSPFISMEVLPSRSWLVQWHM